MRTSGDELRAKKNEKSVRMGQKHRKKGVNNTTAPAEQSPALIADANAKDVMLALRRVIESMSDALLAMQLSLERTDLAAQSVARKLRSQGRVVYWLVQRLDAYGKAHDEGRAKVHFRYRPRDEELEGQSSTEDAISSDDQQKTFHVPFHPATGDFRAYSSSDPSIPPYSGIPETDYPCDIQNLISNMPRVSSSDHSICLASNSTLLDNSGIASTIATSQPANHNFGKRFARSFDEEPTYNGPAINPVSGVPLTNISSDPTTCISEMLSPTNPFSPSFHVSESSIDISNVEYEIHRCLYSDYSSSKGTDSSKETSTNSDAASPKNTHIELSDGSSKHAIDDLPGHSPERTPNNLDASAESSSDPSTSTESASDSRNENSSNESGAAVDEPQAEEDASPPAPPRCSRPPSRLSGEEDELPPSQESLSPSSCVQVADEETSEASPERKEASAQVGSSSDSESKLPVTESGRSMFVQPCSDTASSLPPSSKPISCPPASRPTPRHCPPATADAETSPIPSVVNRSVTCSRSVYESLRYASPALRPPPAVPERGGAHGAPPLPPPWSSKKVAPAAGADDALEQQRHHMGRKLNAAAQAGRLKEVERLLEKGAAVNHADGPRWTPLHRAAARAATDVVALLLKKGADINARTSFGFTPLHLAAYYDSKGECVAELLAAGASVDSWNRAGRTPLHLAAEGGKAGAVQALLAAGAPKNARDFEGRIPADLARGLCVRKLLARF